MNSLNVDLKDKHVVLSSKYYMGDEIERVFLCTDGFGLSSFTNGRAILGVFVATGRHCRVGGNEVKRLATDDEAREAQEHWDQFHKGAKA